MKKYIYCYLKCIVCDKLLKPRQSFRMDLCFITAPFIPFIYSPVRLTRDMNTTDRFFNVASFFSLHNAHCPGRRRFGSVVHDHNKDDIYILLLRYFVQIHLNHLFIPHYSNTQILLKELFLVFLNIEKFV